MAKYLLYVAVAFVIASASIRPVGEFARDVFSHLVAKI